MMVVGVVAILFVGPRELPGMLRTAGQMIRKVRGLAGDFQRQMDDALREAELDGLKDSVNQVRNLNPTKAIKDSLNPLKADLEKTQAELADAGKGATKFSTDDFRKKDPSFAATVPATDNRDKDAAVKATPASKPKAVSKTKPAVTKTAGKATSKPGAAKKPAKSRVPAASKSKAAVAKTPAKKTPAKKPPVKKPAARKSPAKATT